MLWLSWARVCSVQFSSTVCPILCDPMNRSTPDLPVHHQLPEFTQTQVHRVSDAIQPSHPPPSPSPLSPNPSQHQSLFQWVNSSHEVAKVLEFQPQHQSFCASPQISSNSSPGQLLFHVTLQTMKQKLSRFQGPCWKKSAESESSAQQAPKRLTSPLSKRGGNNDDNLFYCAGERRKKMKCSFSKIRQAWLVDFDSKITILIYPTNAN